MLSRQARSRTTASEETTVRHAVITVHLIQEARAAGIEGGDHLPGRPVPDAPADPDPAPGPGRVAALARRVVRFTAGARRLATAGRRPA
jgi:hypothetical protein